MNDHIPQATRRIWMNELMQHVRKGLQLIGARRFSLACGLKKFLQAWLFLSWPTRMPCCNGVGMQAKILNCPNPFDQRAKQKTGREQVSLSNELTNA